MRASRLAKTFLMLFAIAPLSVSAVEAELYSASLPASDQHMRLAAAEVQPSTTLVASDEDSSIALSGFEIQKKHSLAFGSMSPIQRSKNILIIQNYFFLTARGKQLGR